MSVQDCSKNICKIVVTPFIVDKSICKGCFQTIQSAINAARLVGGGVIYIKSGTYTEDITLYDRITLQSIALTDRYNDVVVKGQVTMNDPGNAVVIGITFRDNNVSPTITISSTTNSTALTMVRSSVQNATADGIIVGQNGSLYASDAMFTVIKGTLIKGVSNNSIRLDNISFTSTGGNVIDISGGTILIITRSRITVSDGSGIVLSGSARIEMNSTTIIASVGSSVIMNDISIMRITNSNFISTLTTLIMNNNSSTVLLTSSLQSILGDTIMLNDNTFLKIDYTLLLAGISKSNLIIATAQTVFSNGNLYSSTGFAVTFAPLNPVTTLVSTSDAYDAEDPSGVVMVGTNGFFLYGSISFISNTKIVPAIGRKALPTAPT